MRFKFVLFAFLLFVPFLIDTIEAQSFQTGEIAIVMSNYGRVRVLSDSISGVRQIDRSSFLAGVDTDFVFSYWLTTGVEDTMKNVLNPAISDHEIYGSVNNAGDTTLYQSPDFIVKHNVYGWDGTAYALVKFTCINREPSAQNTVLGMEIISQLDGSYGLEVVYWLPDTKIISQYRPDTSTYVGYKLLSAPTTTVKVIDWYDGYNEVNPDLFAWLTYNQIDTIFESGGDGAVAFFSQDAVNIASGDSAIMWVAISLGADENEMVANMNLAETRYNTITEIEEITSAPPVDYQLLQNYPNPFNPSTAIQFRIARPELVSLKVFDVLGNEVAILIHREFNAGSYTYNFKADNLSSGIYFYRITAGNYSETKKMNLLK